jgi:hypothetical protein
MIDDLDIDLDLLPGQGPCIALQAISWEPFNPQSSYFAWRTRLGKSSRSTIMGDLDLLSQGHSLTSYILRTVWPTEFIFCMGDQVRKVFKVHHDGWPWPTFSRSFSKQAISWEPFDLQSSYFAWGTRLGKSPRWIMMGDLDLLSQGHPLTGYIWKTVWPTEFIFCMGDQVRKALKVHHDGWPWPTFSRSFFSSLYLDNHLTYGVHILHVGPG